MGLYDRVISFLSNKHPGLLKLAEKELSNNPVVFFINETRKLNIQKACILVRTDDFYRPFLSSGLTDETLSESVSTSDFWDGTLIHSDWLTVSHDEGSQFLQLFSHDDISSITKLHIRRFSTDSSSYIFIAAETDDCNSFDYPTLDSLIDSFVQFISRING